MHNSKTLVFAALLVVVIVLSIFLADSGYRERLVRFCTNLGRTTIYDDPAHDSMQKHADTVTREMLDARSN